MDGKVESSVLHTLPLRLSSKLFPSYRTGNGRHVHRREDKTTDEISDELKADVEDSDEEIVAPKVKRRSSLRRTIRRSLSNRFKTLRNIRNKSDKVDNRDRNKDNVDGDKERNNNSLKIGSNIDTGKVGLSKEFGKKYKKVIPRKYKSGSELTLSRQSTLSKLRNSFRRKEKSDTLLGSSRKIGHYKSAGQLQGFTDSLSLNLSSRLNTNAETVDFSNLVKPVMFARKHNASGSSLSDVQPTRIDSIKAKHGHPGTLQLNILSPISSPCLMSPTCADVYGQDEEEGLLAHLGLPFDLPNTVVAVRKPSGESSDASTEAVKDNSVTNCHASTKEKATKAVDVENEVTSAKIDNIAEPVARKGNVIDSSTTLEINSTIDKIDENREKEIPDIPQCDIKSSVVTEEKRVQNCDHALDNVPNITVKNDISQKALRDSLSDVPALPVLDFDLNQTLENPWVLKDVEETDDADEFELSRKYGLLGPLVIQEEGDNQSFGFDVNEQYFDASEEPVVLSRAHSHESVDSFSSSFHSVHSQDVIFSDSEAELEADHLSVSSSDSGTFDNLTDSFSHKSPKSKSDSNLNILSVNKDKLKTESAKVKSKSKSKSSPAKAARSFFGIRPFSVDDSLTKKPSAKDKLSKRRSLDSNLKIREMSLDLNGQMTEMRSKMTASTDSGLSSALSPLMETVNKGETLDDDAFPPCDEVTKFFTMPNPKKHKSDKKRVSRIGSISKKLSEKAQSISNIKLGSSFKLRSSEGDGSKVAPFFKTKSLTNLMAKKGAEMASSISYLIRGRSNSSTSVDSPFKQGTKQKKSDDKSEFVYEKVYTSVPRKRQATKEEIMAWKKRLRLMLNASNNGRHAFSESEFRRRADSSLNRSQCGGIRSPTLLDEIMKSVDTQNLRALCENADDDGNFSDGEESSLGSNQYLVMSQCHNDVGDLDNVMNVSSKIEPRVFITVCHDCGKVRHSSSGSDSSEYEGYAESASTRRCALSLCDLSSHCSCHKYKPFIVSGSHTEKDARQDDEKISKDSGAYVSSPESVESDDHRLFTKVSSVSRSLLDVRQIERALFPSFRVDYTDSSQTNGDLSLLRHRPMLDLSADDLDEFSDDSEKELQSGSKCLTGVSGNNVEHPLQKNLKPNVPFAVEIEQDYLDDDLFTSCSELADSSAKGSESAKSSLKSHSLSDLLDKDEIQLCDRLKLPSVGDGKSKKEARVIKVKSMSSSHDALLNVMVGDAINVGETVETNVLTNDQAEACENAAGIDASFDLKDSFEDIEIGGVKVNEDNGDFDENENVCDKINKAKNSLINNKDMVFISDLKKGSSVRTSVSNEAPVSPIRFSERNITRKPPLPRNVRRSKVLSANDIDLQGKSVNSIKVKRFSFSEFGNGDFSKQTESDSSKSHEAITTSTPKAEKSVSSARRFLFDDQHIHEYKTSLSSIRNQSSAECAKRISASNDDIAHLQKTNQSALTSHKRSVSEYKITESPKTTWSDEVFNQLSFPIDPSGRLPSWGGYSASMDGPLFSGLPDINQETLNPDLETVVKYDVCLGYMLHSIQCDDKVICVYSLQRNKQLMDSVITPLAALPGVTPQKVSSHGSVGSTNKTKPTTKTKGEDLPNPAAPLTSEPSDRLAHAGCVLRTVLLTRASHMIRDRKFHLRTYRRCMVGTEMVDWLMQQSPLVHSRTQAVGMWQALVEEGVVVHVCHEHQFKDKYLFYRFHEDDEGVSTVPTSATKRECEEELADIFLLLAQIGPDAMMRMILRKRPHERTMEDLEIIYEELLHIKALSHLSTMVKRELASVLVFESHARAGTVLFNQGDEGKSWYIILKGSVNVVIYGKGVVCTLHEGDDFGKLALVNDAPRAATIVLRDDNCHFLRVDKDDFNRILRDVEANTVRLKEHGQDVLVLEKIPSNTQSSDGVIQAHYKYSIMAGTPEKMLEHLLESRLDNRSEAEIDGFLEDFLLTHVIFMPYNHLCPVLISHYHSSMAESSEQEAFEFMLNHKKCVLHFVEEWSNIVGSAFREDQTIKAFLEELRSCVMDDLNFYPTLKHDLVVLDTIINCHTESPDGRPKKRNSSNFTLTRKHSKDTYNELSCKRKSIKPTDESIMKVYCADHTYATLKLPMDTTVETLLSNTKTKLGLGEDLVLCEVKSTGERVMFKENDLCVTSGLSINGRLFVTPKEHLDALTPLPEQEEPTDGSFSMLEMFSSREMAYFMTVYDWELFSCVQEYELIYQVFGRFKFGKITANLDLFLRRFNEIQYWVVTEMVLTANLSKRVTLLRKFIKLASYCKEHQNLNSFFAIVMGLSNIAVSRLSQTWEKLPGKFKKMFADFETLMDPSRNHRVYRLSVAKMAPPIIPFMPLLMKDMTFTHEGNKTYFDGLVNFEKMHMISQTLKTVRFCRSMHLDLEVPSSQKSSDVSSYIRSIRVIDNQRYLTQLSHKLEPRRS